MKLKLSVFIGVVLCLVLMGLYGVLSRMFDSRDGWRPNDVYSLVGGSSYSTVSYSSSSSQFGGAGVLAVSVRRGSSFSRRAAAPAFSYAPASAPTYSQSPIGGTPSNSVASPIYTTSSATMKSFGGGNISSSAFASAANSASPASAATPVAASVGMPSVNMPAVAYGNTRLNTNELAALMSGDAALSTASAYAGIGNTTAGGPMSVRGRRNAPGIGDNVLDSWVQGLIGNEGWNYNIDGIDYFDYNTLRQMYEEAIENDDLPPGTTWEQFLSWFGLQSDRYAFPISDGVWFLCIVAMGYAVYVYSRKKQLKKA